MDSVWTKELIISVATEMYEDGTSCCERYPERAVISRGWPNIDNEHVISAIDAYLKLLKSLDEYYGKEIPEYRTEFSIRIRRDGEKSKKT